MVLSLYRPFFSDPFLAVPQRAGRKSLLWCELHTNYSQLTTSAGQDSPIPRNVQTQVPKHRLTDHSGHLNWELIKCFNWKSPHCSRTESFWSKHLNETLLWENPVQLQETTASGWQNNLFLLDSPPQCIHTGSTSLMLRSVTTEKRWHYNSEMSKSSETVCSYLCRISIQSTGTDERLYKLFT